LADKNKKKLKVEIERTLVYILLAFLKGMGGKVT